VASRASRGSSCSGLYFVFKVRHVQTANYAARFTAVAAFAFYGGGGLPCFGLFGFGGLFMFSRFAAASAFSRNRLPT